MHPATTITLRRQHSKHAALAVETLESRLVPYATTGNAWPNPHVVTISFEPDGTNLGGVSSNLFASFNAKWSTTVWQNTILRAAQVWAQQANLNFAVISDSGAPIGSGNYVQGDPTMGDIRIGGFNFGSATLATGYIPPPANSYSIAGDIQFNTGQAWAIGGTYDLFTVAAHEFGHALGLTHSTYATAVMYGYYNTSKTALSSDDDAGIQAIYGARNPDRYDSGAGNGTFGTATDITSLITTTSHAALVSNLDITTTSDLDFYTFTAPTETSSTLTVQVQSKGLSLLGPALTVYAADQTTVLGSISGTNRTGNTLSVTVTGVTAGQRYYVKVGAADSSAFGTGAYALALNFGTGSTPTATSPTTQTPASSTPTTSGGQANDTLLPNTVVTQTVLNTLDSATGANLVPLPGVMPHPPGCICPFCRNGGYAPATPAANPVTPVIEHAGSSTESASAIRSTGPNPLSSATFGWDAVGPVGGNDPARAPMLTAPSGPGLAGTILVMPTARLTIAASGAATMPADTGAETVPGISEPITPATDIPDVRGGFTVEPGKVESLPAGDPALPLPILREGLSDFLSADFHVIAISDSGNGEMVSDHPADADAVWSASVGMAAFLGGTGMRRWDRHRRKRLSSFGPPAGGERRRSTRYPCWLNSLCRPLGGPILERAEAFARDLSTGGVSLLLRRPFEEGIVLAVELRNAASAAERLVLVRVTHIAEECRGCWLVGCTFDHGLADDEVRKLLLG